MLPQIQLQYSGGELDLRFRSTEASLDFGRNHQPQLFSATYISRSHFRLTIMADQGQPRYLLLVEAPHGLAVGGRLFPHGSRLAMFAGMHELMFPMDSAGRALDGPVLLQLPPIEGSFMEWNTGPLAANHDRAVAPPPPSPPPLPRTPPAAPPAETPPRRSWWQRLFD
jgi:hypothetical protein